LKKDNQEKGTQKTFSNETFSLEIAKAKG